MDLFSTNVAYASLDTFLANTNRLIINPLISLLFALAVVFFLYGVFKFLANQENETKRTEGKMHMVWGVVGITVMLGVWTILNIILTTFNITDVEINQDSNNAGSGNIRLRDYEPTFPPR